MILQVGLLVLSYFLSSVPFGLIIIKHFKGIDLRKHGSGNIGATNVYRVAGWGYAILVFLLDGLKGFLPTITAKLLLKHDLLSILVGLVCIIGHSFPIYLKFKGGRAVATAFFVFLALTPKVAISCFLFWVICFKVTKISSLSSILSAILFAILSCVFYENKYLCIFSVFISVFIIARHHKNIINLIKGTETTKKI